MARSCKPLKFVLVDTRPHDFRSTKPHSIAPRRHDVMLNGRFDTDQCEALSAVTFGVNRWSRVRIAQSMNDRRELIVRSSGGLAWTHCWAFLAQSTGSRAHCSRGVRLVAVASNMDCVRVERRFSCALCPSIPGRGRHVAMRLTLPRQTMKATLGLPSQTIVMKFC